MSYKNIYASLLWLLTVSLLTACSLQPADYPTPSEPKADSDTKNDDEMTAGDGS